jgi:cysteine desulfurase/selenocysteine lyase
MQASSPWKKDFPVFNQQGQPTLCYLDSAATSLTPQVVADAVHQYQCFSHANSHKGLYQLSHNATELVEQSRISVANFIGARSSEEIVFTAGATQAINLVARGFVNKRLSKQQLTIKERTQKNIIISCAEHHANLLPWQALTEQFNCELRIVPLTSEGIIDLQAFELLLDDNTLIVSFTQMSNVIGLENPIKAISKLTKTHKVPLLVDGAQSIAHHQVDVVDLGCDFYLFSSHKMYGVVGCGVLYIKAEHISFMQADLLGGGIVEQVSFSQASFVTNIHKFEAGSHNVAAICGLKSAIDYIHAISWDVIEKYYQQLNQYLLTQLQTLPFIQLLANNGQPRPLVSFQMIGVHSHDVATFLDSDDVAIRAGHHCAQPLHHYLNVNSSCRVSLGLYNGREDIDRLVASLRCAHELLAL